MMGCKTPIVLRLRSRYSLCGLGAASVLAALARLQGRRAARLHLAYGAPLTAVVTYHRAAKSDSGYHHFPVPKCTFRSGLAADTAARLAIMQQVVDEASGEEKGELSSAKTDLGLTHVIPTGETKVSRKCELEGINYSEQLKNDCH